MRKITKLRQKLQISHSDVICALRYLTDYKHVSATIPYNSADVITTITNPHEDATKLSKWAILLGNETIDGWAKQCPLALKTIGLFLKVNDYIRFLRASGLTSQR